MAHCAQCVKLNRHCLNCRRHKHPLVDAAMVKRRCVPTNVAVGGDAEWIRREDGERVGHGRSRMGGTDLRPRANDNRWELDPDWPMAALYTFPPVVELGIFRRNLHQQLSVIAPKNVS